MSLVYRHLPEHDGATGFDRDPSLSEVVSGLLELLQCDTCDGSGKELDEVSATALARAVGFAGPEELDNGPCPDCVDGIRLPKEVAKALQKAYWKTLADDRYHNIDSWEDQEGRDLLVAGLRAMEADWWRG
jgi:hypothetical protein